MRKLSIAGLCLMLLAILGAKFTVNPSRFDPYKNFKFRLKWDNQYVAGLSKMSALRRTTEVVTHRQDRRQAICVSTSAEILERLPRQADFVGIDELGGLLVKTPRSTEIRPLTAMLEDLS